MGIIILPLMFWGCCKLIMFFVNQPIEKYGGASDCGSNPVQDHIDATVWN